MSTRGMVVLLDHPKVTLVFLCRRGDGYPEGVADKLGHPAEGLALRLEILGAYIPA